MIAALCLAAGCGGSGAATSQIGSDASADATISLGGDDPFALAVTPDGALWSLSHNGSAVTRISPGGKPQVLSHISGGGTALASAGGWLWAVGWPRALYRIDPADGSVTRRVPLPGADQLAVSPEGLWVSRWEKNAVSLVDADSGKVLRTLQAGPQPRAGKQGVSGVAFGEGSVWAVRGDLNQVYRLDPASGRVQARIGVGGAAGPSTAGGGAIWVTNLYDDTVSRIDPASNQATTVATGVRPGLVLSDGGTVWVSNSSDDKLTRIDAASGAARAVPTCYGPFGMTRVGDTIAVACRYSHTIARVAA